MLRRLSHYSVPGLLLLLAGSVTLRAQDSAPPSPKERNLFSFDLSLAQGVDDNADGRGIWSGVSEVSPLLGFRQERKRGFWSLEYQPTVRHFSAFSTRSRVDHSLQFETAFTLSPRWSLEFEQAFLRSSNPFLRVAAGEAGSVTPGDVLFGPNRAFVGPERRFTQLRSELMFHYRLDYHSQVNFGAAYFRDDEPENLLLDQETRNFRGEYQRRYAKNKSFAVGYSLQFFRISESNQRVRTHSVLFFHNYEFKPGATLALFAGPQYSLTRAEPIRRLNFLFFSVEQPVDVREAVNGLAWGAILTQRIDDRTGMEFSVSRRVSEGGGFTGAVIQKSARLNLNRRLSRHFSVSLGAYLADHRALSEVGSSFERSTWGISSGFRYTISRQVSLSARYEFSRFGSGPEDIRALLARNRFTVALNYSFGRFPIGR